MSNPNGTRGYPKEAQILSNDEHTAGVIDLRKFEWGQLFTDDSKSVLVTVEYLRDMLDQFERLEPESDTAWIIAEDDMPVVMVPNDNTKDIAFTVCPRIGPSESPLEIEEAEESDNE